MHTTTKAPGKDLFEVLAHQLASLGIHDIEGMYAHFSEINARTVRRIRDAFTRLYPDLADSAVCVNVSLQEERTNTCGTTEIDALNALAKAAKVKLNEALKSHIRYGNPLERVSQVLGDLGSLVRAGCAPYNPTGLFVSLMRQGRDVTLPNSVIAAREAVQEARGASEGPAPLQVGDWLKCDGDWQQVLRFEGTNVILYTPEGHVYHYALPDSETRVPRERARSLPRRT